MPDAPDPLADALTRRLLEALPAGQPHGREALARLPAPVAHLLAAALDRRVAREAAPPTSDWLDAEHPALAEAARRWREAARAAARYPAEAWAPALADACRLALRHLVDPAEAAGAFCFAGERGALPAATVRARLAAFGPYPYLREIVDEYVARKGLTHLDRASLEGLIGRIDRRMAAGYGAAEWAALLAPLYALAEVVPEAEGRVPTALLRRFFAARGADALAAALPARPGLTAAEARAALDAALAPPPPSPTVRNLLVDPRDAAAEAGPAAPRPPSPPIEEEPADAVEAPPAPGTSAEEVEHLPDEAEADVAEEPGDEGDDEETTPEPPEAAASDDAGADEPDEDEPGEDEPGEDEPGEDEPLWQRLAREHASLQTPDAADDEPAGEEPDGETGDAPGDGEPLWQRFARESNAVAGPEPLARLEARVLGPDAAARRDWYVEHLTAGAEANYRSLLDALDDAETWEDAWPVLAAAFKRYRVDIYSEPAVAFTDAVEARFR